MSNLYQHLYRPMNFTDYIRVYDDALTADQCQALIDSWHAAQEQQVRLENDVQNFDFINLNQNDWYMDDLYISINEHRQRYWSDCSINLQMIGGHDYEQFKMRRFDHSRGDQQQPYVDVADYRSARRFLTCIWNLNDVEQGGELTFFRLDEPVSIPARAGQLIMFPSTWQYQRAELTPLSEDRFSIQTFLHYQ